MDIEFTPDPGLEKSLQGDPNLAGMSQKDLATTGWTRDVDGETWNSNDATTFSKGDIPNVLKELTGKHKQFASTPVTVLKQSEFTKAWENTPTGKWLHVPDGGFRNSATGEVYILDGANTRGVLFHELGHEIDNNLSHDLAADNGWDNAELGPIEDQLSLIEGESYTDGQVFAGIVRKAYTGTDVEKKIARDYLKKIGMMSLLPIINFGKSVSRSIKSLND